MNAWVLIAIAGLSVAVLVLGFFPLGALRALGMLSWRLEQLESTLPTRTGRLGLRAGKKAPDFTLPSADGPEFSLHDYAGRRVLLVFTQTGCGPCDKVLPELNQLSDRTVQVLVVNNGDPAATRRWATSALVRFPVLIQEHFRVSRQYEVFATPFAFLIDEHGVIRSKGVINNAQHIRFVLSGSRLGTKQDQIETEPSGREVGGSEDSIPNSNLAEVRHD